MENISVNCLNVEKAIKGNLLSSGVSTLAEMDQKNLHKLYSDLSHEEVDKLRSLTEEVKAIEEHWSDFLMTGTKKTIEKRQAVFLTKNLQPSDSEYQEDYFLDEVFGCGEITEVVGPTGCGKTQIAMQL
jgi:flagellar biosynthesis GTPase FlhF